MTEKEFYIYGSQRLGYLQDKMFLSRKTYGRTFDGSVGIPVIPISPRPGNVINIFLLPGTTSITPIYFGNKRYELNDWLGNVRVVINDKKTPVNTGTTTVSYLPQIINVRDYYSFGLDITERSYSYTNTKYRFSFNDKEDIEQRWYQDYGARYYHKALGRFISADPLIVKQKQYAWLSSYQFASNTPIRAIDKDGLEAAYKNEQGLWTTAGDNLQHKPTAKEVEMIQKSYHIGKGPSGIFNKSINMKFTFTLTYAQKGSAIQMKILGTKFGFANIENQTDILGIRENKLSIGNNKVKNHNLIGIGLLSMEYVKTEKNQISQTFGMGLLEFEKTNTNENIININPAEVANIKLSIPLLGIGIEAGVKIAINNNQRYNDNKNKKEQKVK